MISIPEPLPETSDLRFKALYNWANRLRDYCQSLELMRSAGARLTRTPAGTLNAPSRVSRRGDIGVRSAFVWQLPPTEIIQTDQQGNEISTFEWYGLLAFGVVEGIVSDDSSWFSGDSIFGTDYPEGAYVPIYDLDPIIDPNTGLSWYLVDFPPTFRAEIAIAASALGSLPSDYYIFGWSDWGAGDDKAQSESPTFGSGPIGTMEVLNTSSPLPACSDDYAALIDPPYVPGSTLYLARPNNVSRTDRFFFEDPTFGTVELNPGWVDLNSDGRRWQPAGLVENRMRVVISANDDGTLNNDLAYENDDGNYEFPVNQDTNFPTHFV